MMFDEFVVDRFMFELVVVFLLICEIVESILVFSVKKLFILSKFENKLRLRLFMVLWFDVKKFVGIKFVKDD